MSSLRHLSELHNMLEQINLGKSGTLITKGSVLAMKKFGWLWTEEFIWHKKNSHPGKWPNRFRDAWERCLQFNKAKQFQMHQIVLDPFLGSGTSAVAAKLLGRKYVGIEIKEEYLNLANSTIRETFKQSDMFNSDNSIVPKNILVAI
jgi:DNA modification methylase